MATYVSAAHCTECGNYYKAAYIERGYHARMEPCPECNGKGEHEMVIKGSAQDPANRNVEFVNWDGMNKENIRISRSLGVPLSQIDEARKAHPGVEFVNVGNSACPVIHNRAEKLKIMKQAGMVEYPANYFEQKNGR